MLLAGSRDSAEKEKVLFYIKICNIVSLMGSLLDKSAINLQAAKTLKEKHYYYDPSIHCAYYACIQYMMYLIFEKLKITTLEQFDADRRNNREGSHVRAEKLVSEEVARKDLKEYKWLKKTFPELKKLREDADYKNIVAGVDQSDDAIKKSESIIITLKQMFK